MGGVLDQPHDEIGKLIKVLEAFDELESKELRKSESKERLKARHAS